MLACELDFPIGLLIGGPMAKSDFDGPTADDLAAEEFVLQGYDSVTETICVEWRVRIADVGALRNALAPDSDDDPDLKNSYQYLSDEDRHRIGNLCMPSVAPDAIYTGISRFRPTFAHVPYIVHTNFELPLMLDGRKPLAIFGDGYPSEWFDDYLAPFEPFVQSGTIIRRVIDTPTPELKARRPDLEGIRRVYFALPGEEWRIDEYIASIENRACDWNDELERLQGSLLGYEDWQNEWWIEHRFKKIGDRNAG
jgi:hypothetical protein